ncbi:PREDICTED: putative disease resistance protein At1g50180 [Fragaria vesca subsp. vesca]|uniref:putative disease resistance protein At1g50180 n=1 Tax=Fragaria vesca subsp. vesca TaxID=101020 RepID=UPI0002C2E937|nr:PREDICTED: putative disease resistance protein At1g50180 [Fragaria vesca subsp. vesca]
MAEAVVSMVIEGLKPLGNLVIQNAMLLQGVGDQVELAQSELLLMRSFLKDADERQEDDEVVRFWVKVVREAAYDLEDVIESFVLNLDLKRGGSMKIVFKRYACIWNEGVHRYKIGSEIESITTKLSKLRLTMQNYDIKQRKGNEGASSFARQRERRLTYAHISDDHDVVGIGKEVEKLSTYLVEERSRRIVSIWGMGGLGKTTLAKKVYNHEKVKSYFKYFAWICVSQQFEGIAIMKEIFIKLSGASDEQRKEIAELKSDEIAERLYNFQRERKCLVVLDDIWTLDGWNSLKGAFPVNEETNSRIILTTRNEELSSIAKENGLSYGSQALSDYDSWNLFRKIAFSEADETDSRIKSRKEEVGRDMLRQCAGLPLAIIVLAGLLSRKHTVGEWEIVHENVDVHIRRGTDIDREYTGHKYGGVLWILALSCENLPYRLKLCFLYLSHYPEDYEISVKQLIYFWMAEGFISSTSSVMSEDIAYSCFSELVARCMIQVGQIGLTGKIKTCRLHDLMRDMCILKAEEENFFHVANFSTRTRTNETQVGRVRRLAIYLDKEDQLVPARRDDHLRSLIYFSPQDFQPIWSKHVIRSVFNDLKLLRVLKLEDMLGLKKLPSTIGNLVHLRFLGLKRSGINHFPSSVANLVCLQTLDLRYRNTKMIEIPNVFGKMEQLRHLYLPRRSKTVQGQLALGKLQTLVNVEWGGFDLNSLVELTNLRKLFISETTAETNPWKNLEEILKSSSLVFLHLRSLSVVFGPSWDIVVLKFRFVYKLQLAGSIEKLPEGLSSFPNLSKLTLSHTYLMEDQKEILEKLPQLRALYFLGRIFSSLTSDTLVCTNGGFPNLEFLCLERSTNMTELRVEEGAMPLLRRLRIDFCETLRAVPEGLQYVANLKELTVKFMPSEFCRRLGEGGEDSHKIKHVPSVSITGTEFRDMADNRRAERASRRTWGCL